jgi:transcription antitermination factor NusG
MESSAPHLSPMQPVSAPQCGEFAPQWFAVYTLPNHEKRVARQFSERSIPHYLPLYSSVRRWKDRKMLLDLPLFPGYVFVQISLLDRVRVVQVPSLVRLVGFGGKPASLPEGDLAAIQVCLSQRLRIEPHPVLQTGQRVRVMRGALAGIEGSLVRRKGIARLVLSVELIMQAVAVEVDAGDVQPVRSVAMNAARTVGSAADARAVPIASL